MFDILLSVLVFCLLVATHILICRGDRRPGLKARALVFLLAPAIVGFLALRELGAHSEMSLGSLPMPLCGVAFICLLTSVYLIEYVLTELVSPTKVMLEELARGSADAARLEQVLKERQWIETRLNDLVVSGCVTLKDGRYRLSLAGRPSVLFLNLYALILGRKPGG